MVSDWFFSASPYLRGAFGSLRVFKGVSVPSVVGFAFAFDQRSSA